MFRLNASARLIYQEAKRRGYTLTVYQDKHLLKISDGDKWFFIRGSRTSTMSSIGTTIADNKWLTRQLLSKENLPMAKGGYVRTNEEVETLVNQLKFPLVIKPIDGAHGKGVFVGIKDKEKLHKVISQRLRKGLIVEELLIGNDYRVLVVNYKFFAASHRIPASVTGDGKNTVQKLIKIENNKPERGTGHSKKLTKLLVDDLVVAYLSEQNMSLESIPDVNKTVFLRKTAGLSTGGVGVDVTDNVCQENRKLFEQVARVSDLNTVGIDLIAKTIAVPLTAQEKAGILELNSSPGLRMHHYPYQGKTRDAAGAILDMLFNKE